MIRYSLKCRHGHQFESWFKSAGTYEELSQAGHVTCAICGDSEVEKAIMAPPVSAKSNKKTGAPDMPRPLSQPASAAEQALKEMRAYVEKNSDYVGNDFAREARKIHDGEAPDRAIHGEAKPEEAKKLIEDGVPVAPLPFMPNRKTN